MVAYIPNQINCLHDTMKKELITAFALLLLCPPAMADQATLINGENAQKETSKITFDGDKATIVYRDGSSFTYDINAVVIDFMNQKIAENYDGFTTKVQLGKNNVFSISQPVDDQLVVEGFGKGETYKIYNTNGVLLQEGTINSEKSEIDVKQLTAGVYMFCTPSKNIKFIKK